MRVGIPKEIKNHEYRVAATPAGVHELVTNGHEVVIEAGAGVGSSIPDSEFVAAGAQMLARMESVLGGMPAWMRATGRYAKRYFLADGRLFEQSNESKNNRAVDVLLPQSSSLNYVLDGFDKDMADFISLLLALDPNERLGAEDALQHPYLAMGDDGDDDALISRS